MCRSIKLNFTFWRAQVDQNKFDEWWPNELRILATAGPEERLKLVNHIKSTRTSSHGEVVAVTALGVNDGKVLRTADVGLAMVILLLNMIQLTDLETCL